VVGELDAPGGAVRRRLVAALLALLAPAVAFAHVGSPDVIFEGTAGPYPLRVIVRTPGVIPGLADVVVRLLGEPASEVALQPVPWDAPKGSGAPPPDRAEPVRGEKGLYSGSLWLMSGGSYAVRVEVKGAAGSGSVMVPVAAVATRTLEMTWGMTAVLLVLAGLLYFGMVSIVTAATREAVLPPGEIPDTRRRLYGYIARAIALLLVAAAYGGGMQWWRNVDALYQKRLYRPIRLATTVRTVSDARVLRLAFDDDEEREQQFGALMPDHGKLMHLFLIREPALDAIAHLHPTPAGKRDVFEAPLPAVPAGRYRLYADITHESGFAQTLTDSVVVPASASARAGDPDDSWHTGAPAAEPATNVGGGYALVRDGAGATLTAKTEQALRFRLIDPQGAMVAPEPYMGMAAHAVITRDDGSVFVHLHPSGTISMASRMLFESDSKGAAADPHAGHHPAVDPVLSFPYEFPQPGRYRMWVQAKAAGVVRTGAYDLIVAPSTR